MPPVLPTPAALGVEAAAGAGPMLGVLSGFSPPSLASAALLLPGGLCPGLLLRDLHHREFMKNFLLCPPL